MTHTPETLEDLCDSLQGQLHDNQESFHTLKAENERLTARNAELVAALDQSTLWLEEAAKVIRDGTTGSLPSLAGIINETTEKHRNLLNT